LARKSASEEPADDDDDDDATAPPVGDAEAGELAPTSDPSAPSLERAAEPELAITAMRGVRG